MNNRFCFAVVALSSTLAFGSGFEKSTIQSGRYMGIGGAATSSAVGAEALLFNPAGLTGIKGNEITGNVSPTQVSFKAPNSQANVQETSNSTGFPFGFFYGRSLNEDWAIGAGAYVSGGNATEFSQVGFAKSGGGDFNLKPDVYTKLSIVEVSAGAGYRVNEKLRVGFAWRGGMAQVDQSLVAVTLNQQLLINQQYKGLKGSNMMGYRFGLQYDVNEDFGVGLNYRSALHLTAEGKLTVKTQNFVGGNAESSETDMKARTQLPQQINLGGHYKASENWMTYFDYVWTNYGAIDKLIYEGSYSVSSIGGGATQNLSDQFVGWSDQHNIRLAGEYKGYSMPIRLGYVYTSRVSSNQFATSTLTPPGPAHTLSLGSGYTFTEALTLNGAVDYTMVKGSVGPNDPGNATATAQATTKVGDYEATATTAHLGLTYAF